MSMVAIQDIRNFFAENGLRRDYQKGHVICSQGDFFRYAYLIEAGIVKIYDIDDSGTERTVTVVAPDSLFPIILLLQEPPARHLYFYEAFTKASCVVLPVHEFREFLSLRPDLTMLLLDQLAKGYINFVGRVLNLEKSQVHERLEFVLYWLALRLGYDEGNRIARIDAIITQEDIARLAGVTRESMSHEINKARGQKFFWKSRGCTYIDTARLNVEGMPKIYGQGDGLRKPVIHAFG